jgi:hypothetical protein
MDSRRMIELIPRDLIIGSASLAIVPFARCKCSQPVLAHSVSAAMSVVAPLLEDQQKCRPQRRIVEIDPKQPSGTQLFMFLGEVIVVRDG